MTIIYESHQTMLEQILKDFQDGKLLHFEAVAKIGEICLEYYEYGQADQRDHLLWNDLLDMTKDEGFMEYKEVG